MGKLIASHTVEIEADREAVFDVAADLPNSPVWQPSIESVKVLDSYDDGRAKRVEMESDAVVKKTKQIVRFEYDGPSGMTWTQEKGDVKSLDGRWIFEEAGEGKTQATFELEVDPGRMLGMMLRGPVEGKVKEFLTKGAAEGLKEHVEKQ